MNDKSELEGLLEMLTSGTGNNIFGELILRTIASNSGKHLSETEREGVVSSIQEELGRLKKMADDGSVIGMSVCAITRKPDDELAALSVICGYAPETALMILKHRQELSKMEDMVVSHYTGNKSDDQQSTQSVFPAADTMQ